MFSKSIKKAFFAVLLTCGFLLPETATTAAAFSVDVGNFQYSDDSGRSVLYDFSAGTASGNAINLSELANVVTPPNGETGVTYFWGNAPGVPAVTVLLDTTAGTATVSPAAAGDDGVAVLYASPAALPAGADPVAWSYSLQLGNFNVDMTAQKAYQFDFGLGRDESSGGPYNNATVNVVWVKGYWDGTLYPENTLIIQARVQNGDADFWTSTPVVRTGLDPAATALAFSLAVTGGNHFAATADINGDGAASLGEYTLNAGQGSFQRMPDLFPYLSLEERSASIAPEARVQSSHFQTDGKYYANFFVQDPLHRASAVRVTGDGNSYVGSGVDLIWDDTNKNWYSAQSCEIGSTPVTSPWPSFIFTFTPQPGGEAIAPVTRVITGYVTEFATNLFPQGDVVTNPIFSWTAPPGGADGYVIELNDGTTRVWTKYNIPALQTSAAYDGPPLVNGKTYHYTVNSNVQQGGLWNVSLANGSFTYTGGAPTISFSGWVKTVPNWPSTAGAAAAPGATVSAFSPATPPTLINTAAPDSGTGAFLVTGLPVAETFFLRVQPPEGYKPVLSKFINWNADIQAYLPFGLFTTDQYAAFGNTAGTGMILGRVALKSDPPPATTFLAGATVEAREWTAGSPPVLGDALPVTYSGGGSATGADGVYMVKSVPAGKLVQLTATLGGYSFEFNNAVVPVSADTVSEESFFATEIPQQSPFYVYSYHHQDTTYYINLFVEDAAHAFTGVTVNGPGLTGEVSLVYGGGRWALPDAGGFSLGTTLPTGARTYSFTAATGGTPVTGSKTVSVYVEEFATDLQPAGDVGTTPVFSWTGIAGAAYYAVVLNDLTAGGTWIWASPQLTPAQTSVVYDGPALTEGHTYRFLVVSTINTDGNANASFAEGQFTYTAAPTDEELINAVFQATLTEFNKGEAGSITAVMSHFSTSYLNDGRDYAARQAEMQAAMDQVPFEPRSVLNSTVTMNGDTAVMVVNWGDGSAETFYWAKEGDDVWRIVGDGNPYNAPWAGTHHHQDGEYYGDFVVQDPTHLLQSVAVTGPGISGTLQLTYRPDAGAWWSVPGHVPYGPTPPVNAQYQIVMTGPAGAYTYSSTIDGGVADFATALTPAGTVSGALTFAFSGITGADYTVHLLDAGGLHVWQSPQSPSTSVAYTGPALSAGTYTYLVHSFIGNNSSVAQGEFTYVPPGITVSGVARDWTGNVIPAPGVTVTLVGDETKTTTASTTDGSFSLPGIPANTAFSLKLSRAGYLDVYSPTVSAAGDFNMNVSATGSSPFTMPMEANLTALGALPEAGKGLIAGRVVDLTCRNSARVGGAFLTAASGSKSYPVFYRDPFGNLYQGGTTSGNGFFYVLNVDAEDTVILSASKPGWLFNPMTFGTHADSVSMSRIYGTAPGYVTMSGAVIDTDQAAIAGARLEVNGDNGKFVVAGGDGSYAFGNLPRDANFYVKTTAAGYVPHYASINLPGNLSGIAIPMRTAAEMAGAGVTGSNGLIACKVTDASLVPLSGATVTLESKSGTVYTPSYPGGSGATSAAGTVLVPNVLPGDVVKVSVARAGYAFGTVFLDAFAGAVTGRIIAGATPVAYNSYITDKDLVGIAGVTVEQVGASPANATTSSADPAGAYTLNVPAGVPFYLRFSKAGFADTYTAEMSRTAPVNEGLSDGFTLHAATRLADWNVASGKGIIRTRVKDSAGNPLGGAVVLYTSGQGRTYTVCYDDACTPALTATQGNSGRYILRDVEPGDTVTVTARKPGYSFNTRVFHIYAGSVHQGGVTGTNLVNLSASTQSFNTAGAGTGSVNVTAPAGIAWTAVSNDSWITVTAGAAGTGNGAVNFDVAENTGTAARTGTITIGNQAFTITQAGGIPFMPMVFNVHGSDGNYSTYLEVPIGAEFTGTLPDAITALTVTGPGGGAIANLSDFVYYPVWREFLAKLPGTPAIGEYRFEMSSPLAPTTVRTDSYLIVRSIPVPNRAGFSYAYAAGEGTTFTWAAVTVEGITPFYRLIIEDTAGNRVYDSTRIQGMLSHTVPDGTLQPDQLYRFHVRVDDAGSGGAVQNQSRSEIVTFRLNPVSFTGYIADSQSPSQVIAGATVEQGGLPANFATTDGTGLYTLGNLKAGLPFYLKMHGDASLALSYSAEMTYTADRVEPRDRAFTLFPATRLGPGSGNWNVDAGKGIIRAYVRDKLNVNIGGAVVTATGVLQPTYAVCYDDECTPSLTATKEKDQTGAGRFVIKNVLDGDTVTVNAAKAAWTFNPRVYRTFAGGVSQGRITGQGPVSLAVTAVTNAGGSPVQGARLQVVGFPDVWSDTGTNGSATLTGLPPNTTIPFSLGKAGYVNSYGMFSMASGTYSTKVPMFAQANLTTWGVQAGKGVIYGRLMDNANPDENTNSVAGAQVQCTSAQGKVYNVVYVDTGWTVAPGATATLGNGRYLILNVAEGDTVTVSARKAGWSFWSNKVRGYAGGVSYGYLRGTAGGATVTMYVTEKNNAAIAGATVRVAENTALSTTTDGSGKATLTDLPLDTPLTFEVIMSGYRNTYSRNVILTGHNSSWGTYTLFALDDSVSLGGIPADRGVIHGWVKVDADGSNLAGAQVTCGSSQGNSYTVVYLNNDGTIAVGAAATSSNGRFAILDVAPGDTVTATAHLPGWSFEPRTYTARANAVNQSGIYGVAEVLKGDLDGNGAVNLADGIIAMKVLSGWAATVRGDYAESGADVDHNGKVGPAEAIFILQKLAEMR